MRAILKPLHEKVRGLKRAEEKASPAPGSIWRPWHKRPHGVKQVSIRRYIAGKEKFL